MSPSSKSHQNPQHKEYYFQDQRRRSSVANTDEITRENTRANTRPNTSTRSRLDSHPQPHTRAPPHSQTCTHSCAHNHTSASAGVANPKPKPSIVPDEEDISVRKSIATESAEDQNKKSDKPTQPTYQPPSPGFHHTVTNVPGRGLVYSTNYTGHSVNTPFGHTQQPGQYQFPGSVPPTVLLPPGIYQQPHQTIPQSVPGIQQQNLAMAYSTGSMPNMGQHFQPPVPDTTNGPISHTYHPRFDSQTAAGQYIIIDGQAYVATSQAQPQDGNVGGASIVYVPVQTGAQFPGQQTLNTTGNVPIVIHQGGQQPIYVQTPGQPQPGITVVGQQPQAAAQPSVFPPQMVANATMPGAFPSGVAPDVMGIGKTGTEVQMEQYYTALNNGALEGQDIAPADPDPSRMYYVRELDGEWTLRNRFGIDNLDGCRWYVMPGGVFYAVRTPE